MFDLNDMYYFVQIVDHRSVTLAARSLALPKSTVSYRMNQLETQLGVKLINRTSRQFAVTDVGREFYQHAKTILAVAREAEATIRQRLISPSGMVKLSVAVATAQFATRKLLPAFSSMYPDVRLLERTSDSETDIVAEGFDMAIRAHTLPLQDSTLIQRPLASTPWMLFCSPTLFPDANGLCRPEEIRHAPSLFMVRDGVPHQWTLRHHDGEVVSLSIAPVLMMDCMPTLKEAAIAGLGVVALPGYVCKDEISNGSLIRVLPEWTAGDASLTALIPNGQNHLPSVRALLDYFVSEIPAIVAME
jgi:DNA-binding transcriptional LysR family regulator